MAKEFTERNFDTDRIKELVETEISIMKENHVFLEDGEGLYVLDIVSGSYGRYQQEEIGRFFNIDLDEDGICDGDPFISEVAYHISELVNLPGRFYFGYLEGDNAFGLFYYE